MALPDSPTAIHRPAAAMSIDVEDWFHVENLRPAIPRDTWATREDRVERNMDRMLELLERNGARSTCFVLGWVAERCPSLVKRIADSGHEIACHGYGHELLTRLSPLEFREDVRRCKDLLEDLTGREIRGYRAPSFSITEWAIPILRDLGFAYDSSAFPTIAHDRYGSLPGVTAARPVAELAAGFHEVSIPVIPLGGRGLPWGGGGYFRLLPYPIFRRGVARVLRGGAPYVFYTHPWEIDPGQPRVKGLSRLAAFRHYTGLASAEQRFEALLGDFRWETVAAVLAARI
jgi:polysaccharide deacetylase family protein (PEP-CTERM system associated)